jgi:hypothetical protein
VEVAGSNPAARTPKWFVKARAWRGLVASRRGGCRSLPVQNTILLSDDVTIEELIERVQKRVSLTWARPLNA